MRENGRVGRMINEGEWESREVDEWGSREEGEWGRMKENGRVWRGD